MKYLNLLFACILLCFVSSCQSLGDEVEAQRSSSTTANFLNPEIEKILNEISREANQYRPPSSLSLTDETIRTIKRVKDKLGEDNFAKENLFDQVKKVVLSKGEKYTEDLTFQEFVKICETKSFEIGDTKEGLSKSLFIEQLINQYDNMYFLSLLDKDSFLDRSLVICRICKNFCTPLVYGDPRLVDEQIELDLTCGIFNGLYQQSSFPTPIKKEAFTIQSVNWKEL